MARLFTVGHSTRTLEELAKLLREASVDLLIDVRSVPRSRTNPQFDGDDLPDALAPFGIGYEHVRELGGLRGKQKQVEPSLNAYWRLSSFHNYADYALSDTFAKGLARLLQLGKERQCAIMCAESLWWRCHRRIITDYLLAAGEDVFHILGPSHIEPATLTPGAIVRPDKSVVYPAPTS